MYFWELSRYIVGNFHCFVRVTCVFKQKNCGRLILAISQLFCKNICFFIIHLIIFSYLMFVVRILPHQVFHLFPGYSGRVLRCNLYTFDA